MLHSMGLVTIALALLFLCHLATFDLVAEFGCGHPLVVLVPVGWAVSIALFLTAWWCLIREVFHRPFFDRPPHDVVSLGLFFLIARSYAYWFNFWVWGNDIWTCY